MQGPRNVALAKTPVERRAKVGDNWYPIDSSGNVRGAPAMKVGGRFLGGVAPGGGHVGQLSQGDLNALASAFGPQNLARMRQQTIRREGGGSDPIGHFIRGAGHVASLALGVPMMKTGAHELVHWHVSDADKARFQREQDTTAIVDKALLEGMAPQTVMAAAHGHAPSAGDILWDATLFGGPAVKLLRGAREATLGVDAIRAARDARVSARAARAARVVPVYQHPNEAWLNALEHALEERQAVRRAPAP